MKDFQGVSGRFRDVGGNNQGQGVSGILERFSGSFREFQGDSRGFMQFPGYLAI